MSRVMKLFVWEDECEFNANYGNGTVVVMAHSLEEALELIKNEVGEKAWKELRHKPPEVFEKPAVVSIEGSA